MSDTGGWGTDRRGAVAGSLVVSAFEVKCVPRPLQVGASATDDTDWVPSYTYTFNGRQGPKLLDFGDKRYRSQPALSMDASCAAGSNCEPFYMDLDGCEMVVFRVLGTLDRGRRREVRPGEPFLWNYIADLGEEHGHIICNRCKGQRWEAWNKATDALKEGHQGVRKDAFEKQLAAAQEALDEKSGGLQCCSKCFCRKQAAQQASAAANAAPKDEQPVGPSKCPRRG